MVLLTMVCYFLEFRCLFCTSKVCKASFIEDETKTCRSCGLGLLCPKGSTVQLLGAEDGPSLQKGFNSDPLDPLKIYKCQEFCPGGVPGSCLANRTGVTCAECLLGTFASFSGPCLECPEDSTIGIWLACLLVLSIPLLAPRLQSYQMSDGQNSGTLVNIQKTTLGPSVAFPSP